MKRALRGALIVFALVWAAGLLLLLGKMRMYPSSQVSRVKGGDASGGRGGEEAGEVKVRSRTRPPFDVWVSTADSIISPQIRTTGIWEPDLSRLAATILADKCSGPHGDRQMFVDVGAFIGWFSLLAASHGCRVVAFEPQARAVKLFNKSVVDNGFQEQVAIHRELVWDTREPLELGEGIENWGATRVRGVAPKGVASRVPVRVDDFVRVPQRVSLMKVDVESREWHVLESCRSLLEAGLVENIVFELNPALLRPAERLKVLRMLDSLGYLLRQVGPDYYGKNNMMVIKRRNFDSYVNALMQCGPDCLTNVWATQDKRAYPQLWRDPMPVETAPGPAREQIPHAPPVVINAQKGGGLRH